MKHDEAFQTIADKFIQRRGKGLMLSPKDEEAIERLLKDNIPLETILRLIDQVFDEYKPKHRLDSINSFEYVEKAVLSLYCKEREDEDGVHKHSRSAGRSARKSKTYEQVLREAELARKAWGGK